MQCVLKNIYILVFTFIVLHISDTLKSESTDYLYFDCLSSKVAVKKMLSYPIFEGYSRKVLTLTMIFKNNEVLLGMKNRGMGKGKWNGFGGKVEPNETIDDAAKREVKEECGLDVISMKKIGIIDFEYVGSKELLEGHIYTCHQFSGDIVESDEMAPIKWFNKDDTPCNEMWIDHKIWFPILSKEIPFKAHFKYLNDDTMLDSTIILLDSDKKSRKTLVNVVIKKDSQILLYKNIGKSKYLSEHEEVNKGESLENAVTRFIKNNYNITTTQQVQKIAVVYIENIDEPYIQEINVFVLDFSKIANSLQIDDFHFQWSDICSIIGNSWPDNKFFSTLFIMKPFESYFLIDKDRNILCNKYNNS